MESNAESAETCHRKVATSTLKVATSSQKMATFMLKVASDIYKTPLYRTAHSPENFSDEWAFFFPCIKFTFVVTQIATKSWMLSGRFSFTGTRKSCLEHMWVADMEFAVAPEIVDSSPPKSLFSLHRKQDHASD